MRGGFTFSISLHVLALCLLLFGVRLLPTKNPIVLPVISVDVVDMAKESTTNQVSPANKVEKTVQEETPPPQPPQPEAQPTPEPPKPMPPEPPRETIDPATPQLAAVDTDAPQLTVPDVNLRKPLSQMPALSTPDTKAPDLSAPEKVELQRPKPKPAPPSFDSVLKNLAKQKPAETQPQTQPQAQPKPGAKPATGALAQISDKLTASDEDALRQQLAQCWSIPAGAKDAQNLVVELDVEVNPDRTVASAKVVDQGRMASDPLFRAAAMSAQRALRVPQCTPLALPPDKYAEWKSMTLRFDPKEMLGQ